ncbi:MAG: hypothetical protein BEN19_07840 [Epulopiscium sp. Nuni2H_MBin003]|nr:MAG: hypothetical protein BEN19_07840 [Epulopiscium sp. Nuni2H_MBin003]
MLEVENLYVAYGKKTIINNVSFSVKPGTLCGLLGANATGKTTLLKTICNLLPYEGTCKLANADLKSLKQRELSQLISYIPQRCGVNISLSVLDVMLMGFSPMFSIFDTPNKTHRQLALKSLEIFQLSHKAHDNFLTLSEGQKQLVILSRALMQETSLMIFDEPDSALDFQNKHIIMNNIQNNITAEKIALLTVHDANIALKYCNRIILLGNSKIVADLDLSSATSGDIKKGFSNIYTDIDVIEYNGACYIIKT